MLNNASIGREIIQAAEAKTAADWKIIEANGSLMSGQLPKGGLLRGEDADVALGQRLLQFTNLSFGEVGVILEPKLLQPSKFL